MKTILLFLAGLSLGGISRADVLGTTLSELTLNDGTHLKDVRLLRASASTQTISISSQRSMRSLSLNMLPQDLRNQILIECNRASYQRERNIVPTYAIAEVNTIDAYLPARAPATGNRYPTQEDTEASLFQLAAKLAPDELLMQLQKYNQRISGLNCIIRSNEKVSGWQQIRVSGTASLSMWSSYHDDYIRRVAPFEVEFEIMAGEKLRANSVSFDGIVSRIYPYP